MAYEGIEGDPSIRLDMWEDIDSMSIENNETCNDQLFDEYRDMMIKSTVPIEAIIMSRIVIYDQCKFKVKEPRISKADIRREKAGNIPKSKTPYSVFEDMVILTTFCDAQNSGISMNEKIDLVMEDLPSRSFESLRERYRKWLKDLTEDEIEQIIKFCDENYEKCEVYMIKKKQDTVLKRSALESFIPIPKKGGIGQLADIEIKPEPTPKNELINTEDLANQSPDKSELMSKIKRRLESRGNTQSSYKNKKNTELEKEEEECLPVNISLSNLEDTEKRKGFEKRINKLDKMQSSPSNVEKFNPTSTEQKEKVKPPPIKICFSEKNTLKSKNGEEDSMIENESPARIDFSRFPSNIEASPVSRYSLGEKHRFSEKRASKDDLAFKHKSDLFKSPSNPITRIKKSKADIGDNTSEEASLYLSKRNPSENINDMETELSVEDQKLKKKAEIFKKSIRNGHEFLKENSLTLLKLLKFMARYHDLDLQQVVSQIDDNKDLDMSKLRLKLCNQTAVSHILGPKLIRL